MGEEMRKSGLDIIGDVPWGAHICQFYETKEDLIDILIPYFKAGLENNEFCLWVTSQPLEIEYVKEALRRVVPDLDYYLGKDQIEIISYTDWFVTEGIFDSEKILNGWVQKLNHAFNSGYEGVRLSGNTSWLGNDDWNRFLEYKEESDNLIGNYRMIALCTYPLNKCKLTEVIEVALNHQFVLIKKEGKWKRIESSKRKKTEELAIQAKKNWKYTFDAIPDFIAVIDTEYRIIHANKAMAERLEMTPEECVGLTCYRLVHATDKPPSFCPHKQLLNDETEHLAEAFEDCLGGYFEVSVSPINNSEGKLTGSIHVARDINERKKAEKALKIAYDSLEEKVKERTSELEMAYKLLKESEKDLAEAQKMAHLGNWVWDIVADKAYWSEEMYRIFGRSPQKPAPPYKEYLSYAHPDDQNFFDNAHKKAVAGEPYNLDHRIISDNGEERTIHIKCEVIFDYGVPAQLKGIVQDITERKKAEEKIRSLAKIVESSTDAIMTISLDGIITGWNKGAEQIYGYLSEDILGKSASLPAPDHLKGEVMQLIEKVKNGENIQYYETVRIKKDGKKIYVSIALFPIFNTYGKLVAISAIARDISKRIEIEKSLSKANEARKKEIHHRIKNNLQVISSLLDLQAEKFKNKEYFEDSEVLNAFKESQDRVMSIALIHEELHEGEETDTLNFSPYLEKLVENLFQTYKLRSTDISLSINLEENVFFDMDTAVPLGIIVNELISNSLKYAFSGDKEGEIRIKLYKQKYAKNESTEYVLIVSDDGIGIPENIDFENSDTLGLQLVKILVDQLDGMIELRRDKGTEYSIWFSNIEK